MLSLWITHSSVDRLEAILHVLHSNFVDRCDHVPPLCQLPFPSACLPGATPFTRSAADDVVHTQNHLCRFSGIIDLGSAGNTRGANLGISRSFMDPHTCSGGAGELCTVQHTMAHHGAPHHTTVHHSTPQYTPQNIGARRGTPQRKTSGVVCHWVCYPCHMFCGSAASQKPVPNFQWRVTRCRIKHVRSMLCRSFGC